MLKVRLEMDVVYSTGVVQLLLNSDVIMTKLIVRLIVFVVSLLDANGSHRRHRYHQRR